MQPYTSSEQAQISRSGWSILFVYVLRDVDEGLVDDGLVGGEAFELAVRLNSNGEDNDDPCVEHVIQDHIKGNAEIKDHRKGIDSEEDEREDKPSDPTLAGEGEGENVKRYNYYREP